MIPDLKRKIKNNVSMGMVIAHYGYKLQNGHMNCPFHADKEHRLKVREWSFTCYSTKCGTSGNVIDFVGTKEGLNFFETCRHLNDIFQLGIEFDNTVSEFVLLRNEIRTLTTRLAEVERQGKDALFHNKLALELGLNIIDIDKLRAEYRAIKANLEQAKKRLLSGRFDRELESVAEVYVSNASTSNVSADRVFNGSSFDNSSFDGRLFNG